MKIQAIRFESGNSNLFLGLIKARDLIDNFDVDIWTLKHKRGYQRRLKLDRSKKYKSFLMDHSGSLSSTILVNIREKKMISFPPEKNYGTLEVNSKLWLVDGQHRANGIKLLLEEKPSCADMLVPIIIMNHVDVKKEAREFLIINKAQKGVATDLQFRLLTDVIDHMPPDLLNIIGIRSTQDMIERQNQIADFLNKDGASIWKNRIQMPNEPKSKDHIVKLTSFLESLKPILSSDFVAANYKNTAKLNQAFINYWKAIKQLCPKATGKNRASFVLMKTMGVYVMHKIFPTVLIKCKTHPTTTKMKNILKRIDSMNDDDWHSDGEIGDRGTSKSVVDRIAQDFLEAIR